MILIYASPDGIMSNPTFQGALGAAKALVSVATPTCLTVAFGMLGIQVFLMISNAIVFQKGWNLDVVIKVLGFIFFIAFYNELATSIVWTADYISNLFEAKKTVLEALKKISEGDISHKGKINLLFGSIETDFNDFGSFVAWLMSKIQEGLSMFVRILLGKMQMMLVSFMYIAGIFAAMLSTIPGFSSSFGHWLKNLINVIFWSLTLAILDNFMVFFFKFYDPDAADATIDLVVLNLAIIVMYMSVPLLTSMYVGHAAAAGMLSKMKQTAGTVAGVATGGTSMAANAGTKAMSFGKGLYEKVKNRGNSASRK